MYFKTIYNPIFMAINKLKEVRNKVTNNEMERISLYRTGYFKEVKEFFEKMVSSLEINRNATNNSNTCKSNEFSKMKQIEVMKVHIEIISSFSYSRNKEIVNTIKNIEDIIFLCVKKLFIKHKHDRYEEFGILEDNKNDLNEYIEILYERLTKNHSSSSSNDKVTLGESSISEDSSFIKHKEIIESTQEDEKRTHDFQIETNGSRSVNVDVGYNISNQNTIDLVQNRENSSNNDLTNNLTIRHAYDEIYDLYDENGEIITQNRDSENNLESDMQNHQTNIPSILSSEPNLDYFGIRNEENSSISENENNSLRSLINIGYAGNNLYDRNNGHNGSVNSSQSNITSIRRTISSNHNHFRILTAENHIDSTMEENSLQPVNFSYVELGENFPILEFDPNSNQRNFSRNIHHSETINNVYVTRHSPNQINDNNDLLTRAARGIRQMNRIIASNRHPRYFNDDIVQENINMNLENEELNLMSLTERTSLLNNNQNVKQHSNKKKCMKTEKMYDKDVSSHIFEVEDESRIKRENNKDYIEIKSLSNEQRVIQENYMIIFRTLLNILKNMQGNILNENDMLFFMLWLLKNDTLDFLACFYRKQIQSEAVQFLIFLSKKDKIYKMLNNLKIIDDLDIDSIKLPLYNKLVNITSHRSINIDLILVMIKSSDVRFRLLLIDLYIKWAKINQKKSENHYKMITMYLIQLLNKESDKALVLLGKMVLECKNPSMIIDKGKIIKKIIKIFKKKHRLNNNLENVLFCLASIISMWEETKALMAEEKFLKSIFDIFILKITTRKFDKTFLMMLFLLKSMTRCHRFVCSELTHFPIVDLSLVSLRYIRKLKGSREISILESLEIVVNDGEESNVFSIAIMNEIFGILSNLVLGFGNYKFDLQKKNGLRLILKAGRKSPLKHSMLFLFKNLIYDSKWSSKEIFLNNFIQKNKTKDKKYHHCKFQCRKKVTIESFNKIDSIKDNKWDLEKSKQEKNSMIDFTNLSFSNNSQSSSFVSTETETFSINNDDQINYMLKNNTLIIASKGCNIFYDVIRIYRSYDFKTIDSKRKKALITLNEYYNLLRNLICGTEKEIESFFTNFPYVIENAFVYLQRLLEGNENDFKNKVMAQIVYLFVNITSFGIKYREMFQCDAAIDLIMKTSTVNARELKLAVVWLVINLTSRDDVKSNIRKRTLNERNVVKWLKTINYSDPVLTEKIKNALSNLEVK